MEVTLTVRDLNVWYGHTKALRDIDFDVPRNSVTALIGPSGCGKSTLLRCCNKMNDLVPEARIEGQVMIAGQDIYRPEIDPTLVRYRVGMVEETCIDFIATQQPMAGDLRIVFTCLHVTVELERMGDYAEGIGRISLMMGDPPPISPLGILHTIAEKARGMLVRNLDALVTRDVGEARRICDDDDEIDSMYEQVYRGVIGLMIKEPPSVQRATYLLWVAHDLERLADRPASPKVQSKPFALR